MKHFVFTVYDDKSEAYLQPFFLQKEAQAIRTFTDLVNDRNHQFGLHPGDYTLFVLGTFEDTDATWELLPTPVSLGKGNQFQNQISLPLIDPSSVDTQPTLTNGAST